MPQNGQTPLKTIQQMMQISRVYLTILGHDELKGYNFLNLQDSTNHS